MFNLLVSTAYAQGGQAASPQQSPLISFIPFVLIFLVMYFLMIRPQKKRMQEEQNFINKLSQGDEVYMKSGILGKVTGIAEKVVTLETEGGSKFKVLKGHIGGFASQILTDSKK